MPIPRKRSPDGATIDCGGRHLIAAYRKDERLSWPGWLSYSGRFLVTRQL